MQNQPAHVSSTVHSSSPEPPPRQLRTKNRCMPYAPSQAQQMRELGRVGSLPRSEEPVTRVRHGAGALSRAPITDCWRLRRLLCWRRRFSPAPRTSWQGLGQRAGGGSGGGRGAPEQAPSSAPWTPGGRAQRAPRSAGPATPTLLTLR